MRAPAVSTAATGFVMRAAIFLVTAHHTATRRPLTTAVTIPTTITMAPTTAGMKSVRTARTGVTTTTLVFQVASGNQASPWSSWAKADSARNTPGNWIQRLTRVGWDSEALVNGARSFTGLSGDEMALRYLAGGCWVFESLDAANECADGQGCPGGYPYENAGSTASSYYNNVWDDVHHGMFHGLNDAVHVAQTIYWGGTQAQNSRPINCSALEGSGCCGASVYPAPAGSQGASVVQYEISTGGCNAAHAPVTSAHEFGHNAGLDHDDAWGFMAESSKNSTNLSDFNQDLLMGCLGTFNCPRPSGFRYDP